MNIFKPFVWLLDFYWKIDFWISDKLEPTVHSLNKMQGIKKKHLILKNFPADLAKGDNISIKYLTDR